MKNQSYISIFPDFIFCSPDLSIPHTLVKIVNNIIPSKNEYILRVTNDIKGHPATIQMSLDVIISGVTGEIDQKH